MGQYQSSFLIDNNQRKKITKDGSLD